MHTDQEMTAAILRRREEDRWLAKHWSLAEIELGIKRPVLVAYRRWDHEALAAAALVGGWVRRAAAVSWSVVPPIFAGLLAVPAWAFRSPWRLFVAVYLMMMVFGFLLGFTR